MGTRGRAVFAALTKQELASALGAAPSDIVTLGVSDLAPEHLDFLGLVQARARNELAPDAVVLRDGQPLLYVWDLRLNPQLDAGELRRGMERLALRSDAPYVALLRPGQVQVFSLGATRAKAVRPVLENTTLQPGLIAKLAVGDVKTRQDGISTHDLMLQLLNVVSRELIDHRGVCAPETIALIGRALFLRFLRDRRIIPDDNPLPGVPRFSDCLATPAYAAASCRWLDDTFNGDLLSLPEGGNQAYFTRLAAHGGTTALDDLSAIIRGEKPLGDGAYQMQFTWGDLHFAYIPVGLLSQVYEAFVHRFEPKSAKHQSVYYTPRHLAEYLVDHALSMAGPKAHEAKILDPAAGGGVFLLAAFRRLVQGRWRATGKQPTTKVIRDILNSQLVGIEINPAARQLSALALYLTALELDPDVEALRDLKFKKLQDRVLLAAEDWCDEASGLPLGSLSEPVASQLKGKFDVVVGNPPWTSTGSKKLQRAIDAIARSAMAECGVTPVANPDGVPDLPFVWQATGWAKPGGVIAFALHGRLLIKTTDAGMAARKAIFDGMDVTYVLNGLELRGTEVWPNMDAHFCMLFARNQRPAADSRFYAVTPVEDRGLNREGRVRIDSKDAWTSDRCMVSAVAPLFKILAKGNALDVELLERLGRQPNSVATKVPGSLPTLADYADAIGIHHGDGYQVSSQKEDASFLKGRPMMPDPRQANWAVVPTQSLPRFKRSRVHRARAPEIYNAPLVLLRKSPSTLPNTPLAMLAMHGVAYRESYIGFSCAKAKQPVLTATYLWALLNSDLFLYYCLMTSSIFGCERSAMQKSDADQFPTIPLDRVPEQHLRALKSAARAIQRDEADVSSLNAIVNAIYGLSEADLRLIRDRLATALPFSRVERWAMAPPKEPEAQAFCDTLTSLLRPFDLSDTPLETYAYPQSALSPWRFLRIGGRSIETPSVDFLLGTLNMADSMDSSLVEYREGDVIFLGILNQHRYWTHTAARTFALDLIKRDDPVLKRRANAS